MPLMSGKKEISVVNQPCSYRHLESTDVRVRVGERSIWVSTGRRPDYVGFETLTFKEKGWAEGFGAITTEEAAEISRFNNTHMIKEEAIRNHRKAVTASVRFLRAKGKTFVNPGK